MDYVWGNTYAVHKIWGVLKSSVSITDELISLYNEGLILILALLLLMGLPYNSRSISIQHKGWLLRGENLKK